nr:EOG090X05QT [Artemia franciscana]
MYLTRYFALELGVQSQFDSRNNRYIINGSHIASELQNLLNDFIRRFVLCSKCDNPETILSSSGKKPPVRQKCKACGHSESLDATHKLTAYIVKHPPNSELNTQKESIAELPAKSRRKVTKRDTISAKDGKESLRTKKESVNDEDDVEWSEDFSPESVKKRREALTSGIQAYAKAQFAYAKNQVICEGSEKSERDRADIFYSYVKQRKSDGTISQHGVHNDIYLKAERLGLIEKAPLILVQVLLPTNIVHELKKYKKIFIRFTIDSQEAEKSVLRGIEQLIELQKSELLPKTQHILKTLYDEDIVTADVLVRWARKPFKKSVSEEVHLAIMEKAEPLIQWLENESEGEEESDLEIVYDDKVRDIHIIKVEMKQQVKDPETETEKQEKEDIDIDAI